MQVQSSKMTFKKKQSAGFLANHMARLFAAGLQRRLKTVGLAPAQFMVLLELWEDDGLTQAALVERLDVEQATMANTLSRMARDGLIRRVPSPTDKRAKVICLTEKARDFQGAATKAATAQNATAMAGLDAEEQAELIRLMQKVIFSLKRG